MVSKCNFKKVMYFFLVFLGIKLFLLPDLTIFAQSDNNPDDIPQTGFENRDGEDWTTHNEELNFLEEVAKKSERMEYSTIGNSFKGLPLHLVKIGYPTAPSDEEIEKGRSMIIVGSQHGNEPSGREMSLQLMRDLAFTDDTELQEFLKETTILFIPSANPDGREANTRNNAQTMNLNRDHLNIMTSEVQVISKVIGQFDPDIIIDAHERSSSSPNFEMMWPRNLNMDEQLRDLNMDMIENYVVKDVENAGYSTGWYDKGGGDERFLQNMAGLRHSIGILNEPTWTKAPFDRVDMQMQAVHSVIRFYRENFDTIKITRDKSKQRSEKEGAEQSKPFYLDGADHLEPTKIIESPACGYLLNSKQAETVQPYIEAFSLEAEELNDGNMMISMAQPMRTVIPFLLDKRAEYSVVDGLALESCEDLDEIDPPKISDPETYSTDFSEYEAYNKPNDWSTMWKNSSWQVLSEPNRLEHFVDESGGRRLLTWDKIGKIYGDVEVSGLVRSSGGSTLLQLHLHTSGDSATDYALATENSYYLDLRSSGSIRINRIFAGSFKSLSSAKLPFNVSANTWYEVVLQREGETLRAKAWPYGEEEPKDWQVTTEDPFLRSGNVGVGHFSSGVINEWAHYGVGTDGESAPRAPKNVIPDVNKSILQNFMLEIERMELNSDNYTNESWENLQQALVESEKILEKQDATQIQIDNALETLTNAYNGLAVLKAQYQTDFSNYEIGKQPNGWSTLWRDSGWTVLDEPSRLEHNVTPGGKRRLLTMDEVDIAINDVEVSGLVRSSGEPTTLFQIQLHALGEAGNENSYYLDLRKTGYVRINRNLGGSFSTLKTAKIPFSVEEDVWYQAVFKRENNMLKGKVWPYGEKEPVDWQITFADDSFHSGYVGVGHSQSGMVNEWGFFGVGVGGESAPRAPEDLFDPKVDKSALKGLIEDIEAEDLEKADYTEGSWDALAEEIERANAVLSSENATQDEVDTALKALTTAYEGLEKADKTRKDALQEKVDEIKAEELEESHYTDESWKAFHTALKISEELLIFDKINESIIEKALNNLELAYEELMEK